MSDWQAPFIEAMHADLRRNTSTCDRKGTQRLVASSITDKATADKLINCRRGNPCRLACCPICARRRAAAYFKDRLAPSIVRSRPSQLRFVTVNVCATDDLSQGAAEIAGRHHRHLRKIIAGLRANGLRTELGRLTRQIRIWGTREVETRYDPATSKTRYLWHWHLVVDLDGVPEEELAQALRAQWPDPRAVRIDTIRADTDADAEIAAMLSSCPMTDGAIPILMGILKSLARITRYAGKVDFTYRYQNEMHWLPAPMIDELCTWMTARPSHWMRFSLTPAKATRVTKTVTTDATFQTVQDGSNTVILHAQDHISGDTLIKTSSDEIRIPEDNDQKHDRAHEVANGIKNYAVMIDPYAQDQRLVQTVRANGIKIQMSSGLSNIDPICLRCASRFEQRASACHHKVPDTIAAPSINRSIPTIISRWSAPMV